MTNDRTLAKRGRVALAAAAMVAGGILAAATGMAQAAPLAPVAAETVAGESGATAVHWRGRGRGHHFGRHHHHRHFGGWGRPRHFGWGHRHHHRHHHHGGGRHRW